MVQLGGVGGRLPVVTVLLAGYAVSTLLGYTVPLLMILNQDLERWMANTQTPDDVAGEVRRLVEADEAQDLSGTRPFRQDGSRAGVRADRPAVSVWDSEKEPRRRPGPSAPPGSLATP